MNKKKKDYLIRAQVFVPLKVMEVGYETCCLFESYMWNEIPF